MKEKLRIAILGIGGVGGYFGGKLAKHFADSKDTEIIFIARGENAKTIRLKGLQVVTSSASFQAKPHLVSNEADEIGIVDLFLVCTKAYSLEESIIKFRECLGEKTVILPLLNGVNHAETIKKIVPNVEVWNGCAFIVSRLIEAGVVKIESDIKLLQFGSFNGTKEKLEKFDHLLKSAGIDAELSSDIDKTVWEKFIFISSLATLTSYLDTNVGGVNSSVENQNLLIQLIAEVTSLAKAKKINIAGNIEEITFERIKGAPPESTSSLHSDFMKKGKTELETVTGYVVREGQRLNLPTPTYERLYAELMKRNETTKSAGY